MNDDVITDLKQFIAATVSQQGVQLEERLENKLGARIDAVEEKLTVRIDAVDEKLSVRIDAVDQKLTQHIDDLTAFVTEALDTANETAGQQLADHERRLTRLEHATV